MTVDFNHPYAGKDLEFKVQSQRVARQEGPGSRISANKHAKFRRRYRRYLGSAAATKAHRYEYNETARIRQALDFLERGEDIALISDAGTPLMSDPGYLLVRACREAGFCVRPVPGPCAAIAALMTSGLPPYPFYFAGFLPRKDSHF